MPHVEIFLADILEIVGNINTLSSAWFMLPKASLLSDLDKFVYVFAIPSSRDSKHELDMRGNPCSIIGELTLWKFAASVAVELGKEVPIQGIRRGQAFLE